MFFPNWPKVCVQQPAGSHGTDNKLTFTSTFTMVGFSLCSSSSLFIVPSLNWPFRPFFLLSVCNFHFIPLFLLLLFSVSCSLLNDDLVDCSREQVQVSLLCLITSAHAVLHTHTHTHFIHFTLFIFWKSFSWHHQHLPSCLKQCVLGGHSPPCWSDLSGPYLTRIDRWWRIYIRMKLGGLLETDQNFYFLSRCLVWIRTNWEHLDFLCNNRDLLFIMIL